LLNSKFFLISSSNNDVVFFLFKISQAVVSSKIKKQNTYSGAVMALISCPECNKQVSDAAHTCPNCAYPISNDETFRGSNTAKAVRKGIVQHEIEKQAYDNAGCGGCILILPFAAGAIYLFGSDSGGIVILLAFVAWIAWLAKVTDWYYKEK
jgi:hypothetical protein